jgi:hypothetical protein
MCFKPALVTAAACFALAGCNTANTHIGDADPFIGEAVKYNAAIQTINPAPVYTAEAAQPGSNGAKGEKAVERYRTDKVNARHKAEANVRNSSGLSTTQGVGGGGGGPQ